MHSFVRWVFLAFCLLRRFAWRASLSRQTLWRFLKHITILPLNVFTVCLGRYSRLRLRLRFEFWLLATIDYARAWSLSDNCGGCSWECLQNNSSRVFIIFAYAIAKTQPDWEYTCWRAISGSQGASSRVVCANWNWDWGLITANAESGQGRPNGLVLKIGRCHVPGYICELTDSYSYLTVHWRYLYPMSANWRTKEKLIELIGAADNKRRGRCAAAVRDGTEYSIYSCIFCVNLKRLWEEKY